MKKEKSGKLQTWSKKDIALNIVVYVVNLLVIMGLFILSAYINCFTDGISFKNYMADVRKPLYLFVMMILCVAIMAVYFFFEDRNFMKSAKNSQMIFTVMEFALIVCYALGKFVNIYLRPLALVALFTLFLTNRKTAIFTNVIFCLMVLLMDSFTNSGLDASYSSLLIGFTSGMLAIYLVGNEFSRWGVVGRSIIISAPTVIYLTLAHFEYGLPNFLASIISGASSGFLTGVLFFAFISAFENIFGKVTCFKLAELTDHKSRLIRKIITEAPGTFNHSIVLSNIAEACALAIGEDSLLARTCAYYHDVGKLRRPEFFMENQTDKVNPHDDLTPELSTNIIRSHAQDGYQLVLKHGLPKEIADVCLEHHGTMPIFYFYGKAKKFTDGEVDIAQYSYYGPKPQTKIAAIIMIADGCEAAVRTLADRSRDSVTKVVRKIVSDRMALGQFDECEITLKELNIIINTVVNSLTGVYHSRVEYPTLTLEGITEESPLVSGGQDAKIEPGLIEPEKKEEPVKEKTESAPVAQKTAKPKTTKSKPKQTVKMQELPIEEKDEK
ncbi:MAG: HDIG domain-containing protein [Clostridia bacterium]|nr:HDIG domain-containing protein [Clostridia bacterium]